MQNEDQRKDIVNPHDVWMGYLIQAVKELDRGVKSRDPQKILSGMGEVSFVLEEWGRSNAFRKEFNDGN